MVSSLRLLRSDIPDAFGLHGPDAERRLSAALDELVAGMVGALRDRVRLDRAELERLRPTRRPPSTGGTSARSTSRPRWGSPSWGSTDRCST
ncbi:hypothetical protein BJF90_31260 [Pseudonocardia sp. CNS-004]|nr:hypothetical protein BJF90_31260 [Pseudonocardia sp. CNS-004]